jgi:PGF-pre-PGF domain-containing protein
MGDPVDKNTIYEDSMGDPIDDVSVGDSIGDSVDKNTIYEDSMGDPIDKNTIYETTYYTSEGDGTAENIVTLSVGVGDITAGNRIEVAIEDTQGSACVNRMDFTSNKNLADVHVHVTRLKERPEEIQKEPKRNGTIYEYLDLKITTDDIYLSNMSTRIRFNVSKEWINENDIDISTIRLMRYHNDTWQELNTTFLLDKNTTNASFIAETPGFSTFAVVGSANVMSSDTYAPETANIPLEAIIGIITAIVALLIIVLFKARYIYFGDNHTVEKPKKKN